MESICHDFAEQKEITLILSLKTKINWELVVTFSSMTKEEEKNQKEKKKKKVSKVEFYFIKSFTMLILFTNK